MKKILLLIVLSFSGFLVEAQQSLELEVNKVWNSDSPSKSMALTWYHADGFRSGYALRASYISSSNEFDHFTEHIDLAQLDVVKRWHNPRTKKVTIYGEIGITGMVMNEAYNNYYGCCDYILVNTPPERTRGSGYGGLDYKYKNNNYVLFLLPGATVGAGLNVNLTKHLYLGLQSRTNTYYWAGRKKWLSYFHSGMNVGFRF